MLVITSADAIAADVVIVPRLWTKSPYIWARDGPDRQSKWSFACSSLSLLLILLGEAGACSDFVISRSQRVQKSRVLKPFCSFSGKG